MTRPGGAFWYARHRDGDSPGHTLTGMATDQFPDRAVVDLPGPAQQPTGWALQARVPVPGRVPSSVVVAPAVAPRAPHLWCVLVAASPDRPGRLDLIGFSTAHHPDGAVMGPDTFAALDIAWSNQVCALRWDPRTGVVEQVYVAPEHRRLGLATKLTLVAAGVGTAMGWASMRSDGRLTDLGDTWLSEAPDWWRHRVPTRTAHLPPMTPGDVGPT